MNQHIVFGLFALCVAAVSLSQVLFGQQDKLLALLRRFWGRRIGHSLYFMSHVAVPLLVCIVCLGWGIRNYDASLLTRHVSEHQSDPLRLDVKDYRFLPHHLSHPDNFALWEQLIAA